MAISDTNKINKELVRKISDRTITVAEFLGIHGQKSPRAAKEAITLLNTLDKAGVDLTSPWSDLATDAKVAELLKHEATTSATFQALQPAEKNVETFYRTNKGLLEGAERYPFTTAEDARITGDGGIARRFGDRTENPKAYQVRGTKRFTQVPAKEVTIPAILDSFKNVKDPQTRAALFFNVLVPYRAGEVAGLTLDDVNLETGEIRGYKRGQKTRAALQIPDMALDILRIFAEDAKSAKPPREKIFDTTRDKMTKAIKAKGGLADLMKAHEVTLGRPLRGASDLRKLIPSLLAYQVGEGATVSSILGHTSEANILSYLDKITGRHYVSPIAGAEENANTRGLRVIQHMVGQAINAQTLKEIPAAVFGEDIVKRLPAESTPVDYTGTGSTKARELTPAERAVVDQRTKLASTQLDLNQARTEGEITSQKIQNIEALRDLAKRQLDPETMQRILEGEEADARARQDAAEQRRLQSEAATQARIAAQPVRVNTFSYLPHISDETRRVLMEADAGDDRSRFRELLRAARKENLTGEIAASTPAKPPPKTTTITAQMGQVLPAITPTDQTVNVAGAIDTPPQPSIVEGRPETLASIDPQLNPPPSSAANTGKFLDMVGKGTKGVAKIGGKLLYPLGAYFAIEVIRSMQDEYDAKAAELREQGEEVPFVDVATLRGQQAEQLLTIVGLPLTTYDVELFNKELEERGATLDMSKQSLAEPIRTPYDDPLFLDTTAPSDQLESVSQSTMENPAVEREAKSLRESKARQAELNKLVGIPQTGAGFVSKPPNLSNVSPLVEEYEGFIQNNY